MEPSPRTLPTHARRAVVAAVAVVLGVGPGLGRWGIAAADDHAPALGYAGEAPATGMGSGPIPGLPVASVPVPGLGLGDVGNVMVRVARPVMGPGPRRVGIQAGHWKMAEVPDELRRIAGQTGTTAGGVTEWQVNLDVAERVASRLRGEGIAVDILPAAVPAGYLADAFVSLHADGDRSGHDRGFKVAHGSRRGPYEGRLAAAIGEEYGRATGLPWLPGVSRNMTGYYAFAWGRFAASVAPHVPAAILEMGFLTSEADRVLLVGQPDRVADGVTRGIRRFLEEVPAGAAFAEDLVMPVPPSWGRRVPPGA